MSATSSSAFSMPTVEVTERSDHHLLPALVGVALFLATVVIALAFTGLPQ